MSISTTNRETAIATANEAYASAREYIEGISEVDMLRPDRVGIWSGKDLVVHLGIWEREGARVVCELAEGKAGQWLPEGVDIDTFNQTSVAEHTGLSLAEALDFWEAAHRELVDIYRTATIERDDLLLGSTREHYREHYPDFRHVKPFQPLDDDVRATLLSEMDAAQQQLLQMIESVAEAKLLQENTVGIWSGKDLIAHLGHWLEAAATLTRELENDRPGKWPGEDGTNINEWNEARVKDMRDLSLDEVRAYQQRAYDELRALIRTSPYATRSAGIGATTFHYDLHAEDFESLR